jgi:hypothetical protein
VADPPDQLAIEAWNLLSNGQGGIDWSGMPTVVAYLGIHDVEDLIHRLRVIKQHKPPETQD